MKDRIGKSQFKYLDYLFEGMYSVKSKFYPDSTFFKKNDKVILELEKSGTLWVLYSVWTDISNMFPLDYSETQQLIKAWMEQQIKKEEVAPSRASSMYGLRIAMVEEKLKSEEITPLDAGSNYLPFMEKQLKQEEITPKSAIAPPSSWRKLDSVKYVEIKPNVPLSTYHLKVVEEKLKSEEVTPRQVVPGSFDWIQEQINLGEVTPTSFFVIK
jgi:hypothetical protein